MFTQCPECKTIFGFNEEHTQVANGQVRCSQCSHVFVAMAHAMEELPTADNSQPIVETTPVPAPEVNDITEETTVASEPAVEETSTGSDDDPFSLLDDANDFMAAISDDFERPEPSSEENIVFNELETATSNTPPEPSSEAEQESGDITSESDTSTIETAMAEETVASTIPEEKIIEPETEIAEPENNDVEVTTTEATEAESTEPVAASTTEADEADNLADEWASMLEEETTETEPEMEESSVAETPTEEISEPDETTAEASTEPTEETPESAESEQQETEDLASEWASMLDEDDNPETSEPDETTAEASTEPTAETPEPAESEQQETEDLASEWANMLDEDENSELTTDIEKAETTAEVAPTNETVEPSDVETSPTEEAILSESTNDEGNNELNEKSSLEDFLESQIEDFDGETTSKAEEAEALDISLHNLTEQTEQPVEEPSPPPFEADPSFEADPVSFDDIIPTEDNTNSRAIMLAFIIGILTSLVLLTSQYIYTMRDELSQIASVRPSVIKFCEFTECSVPLYSNLEQIEFISQDVRSHPRYHNALMVTLVFINNSPFYQAYPVIQFKLSDIEQNPVAARYFLPESYLDASIDIEEGVKPGTPIRAVLEINDPGEQAVNYDFDFR